MKRMTLSFALMGSVTSFAAGAMSQEVIREPAVEVDDGDFYHDLWDNEFSDLSFDATAKTKSGGNQFSVVCIRKSSGQSVNFNYRWGNGSWQKKYLSNGWETWFSWPGTSSPRLYVKFDYDLRPGRNSQKSYKLDPYASPFEACKYGKQYKFMKVDGQFLELYNN